MLTFTGKGSTQTCDGVTRRDFLHAGALGAIGLSLSQLMSLRAMVKVAEVLGEKMDRLSVRVDEGVGGDLQVVIDRMSDAIQAMSGQHRRD